MNHYISELVADYEYEARVARKRLEELAVDARQAEDEYRQMASAARDGTAWRPLNGETPEFPCIIRTSPEEFPSPVFNAGDWERHRDQIDTIEAWL